MKNFYLIFLISLVICLNGVAQYNYPATKIVDSTDTYWGVKYKDPYRWLENIKSPEVEAWFKKQADLTNSILGNITGRDELINEYKKLDKLQPPKISGRKYEGGRIFYKKTIPGEKVGKLYYRNGMAGQEIMLFDPTNFIAGKTLSIQSTIPSYDGKKLLYLMPKMVQR